jgi:phosphate butyryltransferase
MEMCAAEAAKTQADIEGPIRTFAELRDRARKAGPRRVGVVQAEDDVALTAASHALLSGIATPVLLGNERSIRERMDGLGLRDLAGQAQIEEAADAGKTAVRMARDGRLDLLLKGHLRTDELLRPVLDKEAGLRTGKLLCDVAFFEHRTLEGTRLVGISDGGLNVAPTLEQKKQIVVGAIDVLRCLGVMRPSIAILSATEVVTATMPSTLDADALTRMCAEGEFGDADVYGPLALDNALFEWAARAKGIENPVAGHADCLIVPNIEAGNLLGKAVAFLAGWQFAHVIAGAKVPILIPSRVESAEDKVNAIALGVLYAGR